MIAIKDFKMPKSCSHCVMLECLAFKFKCRITKSTTDYGFNIFDEYMPDCPLIEVLIDKVIKIPDD